MANFKYESDKFILIAPENATTLPAVLVALLVLQLRQAHH